MADTDTFLSTLGRLFSRTRIRSLGRFLEAGGVDVNPELFAGAMFAASLAAALVLTALFLTLQEPYTIVLGLAMTISASTALSGNGFTFVALLALALGLLAGAASVIIGATVYVQMRIDARNRVVEAVLPNFLMLAAGNMRAGMTIDQAMWYAAKPQFGIFSKEIELVAKRTFGGEPFVQSLSLLAERFQSKTMKRTVSLIKQGIASGGELAKIMEQTAEDARNMQLIRKEIATQLLMYVIFIVFAASIGTPFMFAVSEKLIFVLEGAFANLPSSEDLSMGGQSAIGFLKIGKPPVTAEQFNLFAYVTIFITSAFSAMIVGVIQRGNKRDGVKYFPLILIISLTVYIVTGTLLGTLFQNLAV